MTVTTSARITALDPISASSVTSADVYVMVDVSDTTMAATGTDFKQRADELASTVALQMGTGALALSKLATDPLARANHTGTQLSATVSDLTETVQDIVAADLITSTTLGWLYNDAGGVEQGYVRAASLDVSYISDLTETVQDIVAADLITSTTIGWLYSDASGVEQGYVRAGSLDSTFVSDFTEAAQDVVGGLIQSTTTIAAVYNDAGGIETLAIGIDVYAIVQAIDNVTSTNYTLVLTDAGHFKRLNTAAAGVVRLPLNASVALPIGTHIDFQQVNVGQYTFTTQAGVTIIANPATPKTTTSAMASVVKTATDEWGVGGYLV